MEQYVYISSSWDIFVSLGFFVYNRISTFMGYVTSKQK